VEEEEAMFGLIVSLRIKPDQVERFLAAIEDNARASRDDEPGCVRFDVYRDNDDPHHYLLHELYRDEAAFRDAHRATPHFRRWREAAAACLEPGGQANTYLTPLFADGHPDGERPAGQPMVLRAGDRERFDRGAGVVTLPYAGKWNAQGNRVTTGITAFAPGTGIPLHTHNVEESVLVLEGEATAELDGDRHELAAGDATWVPAGVPHRFANRGQGPMRIHWVYGGREVTRTIVATGETVEHLSEADRGATRDP
jgi:HTH-type transcriptional regulator, repressor for puuD